MSRFKINSLVRDHQEARRSSWGGDDRPKNTGGVRKELGPGLGFFKTRK